MSNYAVLAQYSTVQRSRMLCVVWAWFLAPLRSGGLWWLLKALSLVCLLPNTIKDRVCTYQWAVC